ncbi:MAG: hypothetical protein LBU51_05485 [Bacteroidales bacterium]|nr:hypothetical protein [Bacteroidales bacterium]
MIQSFYYAEYQTQVNTYFIYHADNFPALFEEAFCINSILPTSLFQHNTQLSNYLIEDSTAFLFCKSGKQDNVFLRVNNQGIITDTLYANFGLFAGKPLTFWSFMTLLPLPKTGENRNYVTYLGIVKENDYQRNLSTRLRLFSSHYLSEITVTKDSILLNHFEKYLNYPKNYLSKNMVYQSYWPSRVTLNKI